jgi:hypothetical protein
MTTSLSTSFPPRSGRTAATPLHLFVQNHRQGLWHAAGLLGGNGGQRLADEFITALAARPGLSPRAIHLLKRLLRLLSLEDVALPDSVEAASFAAIDPADPAVEEICLLVDGLREAVAQTVAAARARRSATNASHHRPVKARAA